MLFLVKEMRECMHQVLFALFIVKSQNYRIV